MSVESAEIAASLQGSCYFPDSLLACWASLCRAQSYSKTLPGKSFAASELHIPDDEVMRLMRWALLYVVAPCLCIPVMIARLQAVVPVTL